MMEAVPGRTGKRNRIPTSGIWEGHWEEVGPESAPEALTGLQQTAVGSRMAFHRRTSRVKL